MNQDGSHYCDVLIIGSGIAGLSAAIVASEQGLDVIVVTKQNSIE
jgi:succinate dehydrogenase/fumarate reductase flavoprotein subunit